MSKSTQADQVVAVVARLGGIASLSQLNEAVDVSEWDTKTPFASIRRIVQNDARVCKIKPGLYCMRELHDRFAVKYDETADDAKRQMSNHSYYQGLLLQMGRMRNFRTYAPPQDKNKQFLESGKLSERIDIPVLPEFGYEHIIRNARTVDVIWFNRREMPSAFYEVEMTTGIKRSLQKFHELQDFHAQFVIVAPDARREAFDDSIAADSYNEIRERVEFLPTQKIVATLERIAKEAQGLIVR